MKDNVFVEVKEPVVIRHKKPKSSQQNNFVKSKPIPIPVKKCVSYPDISEKQIPCFLPFYPKNE